MHGTSEVLTEEEATVYASAIPKLLRKHRQIAPAAVERALDKAEQKGRIGVTWLANCLTIDLNNAVEALVARGKEGQALWLLETMARYRRTNQLSFAAFFKGCRSVGRPELAMSAWEGLSQLHNFGARSAHGLLKCLVAYDPDEAFYVFKRLHQQGALRLESYNLVIATLGADLRFDDVLLAFTLCKAAPGVKPDVLTFQALLDAVASSRAWWYTETVHDEIFTAGVQPDSMLCGALMKSFGYAGNVHMVKEMHHRYMERHLTQPSKWHYNALILVHARQGRWGRARNAYWQMLKSGCAPDEYTTVALFTAIARCPDTTTKSIVGVQHMMREYSIPANVHICAALLQAYRTCRSLAEHERCAMIEAEIAKMERAAVPITAEVMNVLIATYGDIGEYAKACATYDRMVALDILPTTTTYRMMVDQSAAAGEMERAREFQELEQTMRSLLGDMRCTADMLANLEEEMLGGYDARGLSATGPGGDWAPPERDQGGGALAGVE